MTVIVNTFDTSDIVIKQCSCQCLQSTIFESFYFTGTRSAILDKYRKRVVIGSKPPTAPKNGRYV